MIVKGKVFKYGDDINTDVLFPGKYTYTVKDPKEMASHALEDLDPGFASKVKKGDIVLGGRNFGCGSSREQAATCLKYAGVGAVIAGSFSRLYFRNAINAGLPLVQNAQAVEWIEDQETVEIDFEKGTLVCRKGTLNFPPLPDEVVGIMEAGGLVPYTRKSLGID
ncbi:MAG: 3-isopropylmalate dehydratase [Planctomycetota bacterium]